MMGSCGRCGGQFPTRTSGIEPGAVLCTSASDCDANLEDLRIDAAVGALALLFAERRSGHDRRATDRGELDRRQDLEALREVWDRG